MKECASTGASRSATGMPAAATVMKAGGNSHFRSHVLWQPLFDQP
jgi:hypothetical protein